MKTIGANPGTQAGIDIVEKHVFFTPQGPPKGWQAKPELPTADEIWGKQVDTETLPENPVDVPWDSKDKYLEAQYKILRHEAVEGLRFSVRTFIEHRAKQPMTDDDHTCIYTKVRVKEYVMTIIGPLARVGFSTERSRYRILWHQSKRLQPGKVVALSPKSDGFKTICKIATIAQRPYRDGLDQDPPLVDLQWADPKDAVLDPGLEMIMIESWHGYFESARHALVGLQHAAQTQSPFDKYLTGVWTKDNHPSVLQKNPIMDLSSLLSPFSENHADMVLELKSHDIVNQKVPDLENVINLDTSQLEGLHRIVSKELAIVQGPPGTGKTYTSVEAIKVLVASRRRQGGPPIIVAAQTNHALDQLLTHCIRFGANVLRLGGRTKSDILKKRTLYQLRMGCRVPADNKCSKVDNQRRENHMKVQELVHNLFSDSFLDPDTLLRFGIITRAQHDSLCDESMEKHAKMEVRGPFALWLGESIIPAKILEDRHPTFSELTEAEARKNLPEFEIDEDEEMENIADDEEDLYRLTGTKIGLKHVWSGKNPASLTSWDRAVKRALRNDDLFAIDRDLRGAVYQYFQGRLLEAMTSEFSTLLAENIKLCKQRKAFKFLSNTQVIEKQKVDIVGCTTTGLSKYRGCLAALKPQTLLIEEAAETREANIVSALYPSLQKLVLVGDHKQLAPKCDIPRLGEAPYNLNVSLFQRLVNLNMPFVMLKEQRRMRPELRKILNSFYPELIDHHTVEVPETRPDVLGMGGRNMWFFHHTWPENTNAHFSKFNEHEADMITQFFAYLVRNGTPPEKITVLTFYRGQQKELRRKLSRHPAVSGSVFNICTVDSYQGEENDIILLSLVRSPQLDRAYAVGFLEDERRAVVAISRARRGLFVFGNVKNILGAHENSRDLWYKVCLGFGDAGCADWDRGMPIVCQQHQREVWIKDTEDWGDNAGGCDLPCGQMRPCGHPCLIKCHVTQHPHIDLPCAEPCTEKLECGHGCQNLCGKDCACDCKAFKEAMRERQITPQRQPTFGEILLQMGAPPTEMLKASMNQRGTSRQLPQIMPSARGPYVAATGEYKRPSQQERKAHQAQLSQAVTLWQRFRKNVKVHDEKLEQEHLAAMARGKISEPVIREVYKHTSLVAGRRVGADSKLIQQVKTAVGQASTSRQTMDGDALIPDIPPAVASLVLKDTPTVSTTPLSSSIPEKLLNNITNSVEETFNSLVSVAIQEQEENFFLVEPLASDTVTPIQHHQPPDEPALPYIDLLGDGPPPVISTPTPADTAITTLSPVDPSVHTTPVPKTLSLADIIGSDWIQCSLFPNLKTTDYLLSEYWECGLAGVAEKVSASELVFPLVSVSLTEENNTTKENIFRHNAAEENILKGITPEKNTPEEGTIENIIEKNVLVETGEEKHEERKYLQQEKEQEKEVKDVEKEEEWLIEL